MKDADIVHIFNCRVHESFVQQVETCISNGKKYVVSPIWISLGRALWGSRCSTAILGKAMEQGEEAVQRDLEQLKNRNITVEIDGKQLNPDGKDNIDNRCLKDMSELLNRADGILPNSWLELKAVQTDLGWKGDIYEIAPYGVDPKIFLDASPELFRRHTGIQGKFIMQAGRIEPGKNQAMLCWALKIVV